jgi:hypothetical protein
MAADCHALIQIINNSSIDSYSSLRYAIRCIGSELLLGVLPKPANRHEKGEAGARETPSSALPK